MQLGPGALPGTGIVLDSFSIRSRPAPIWPVLSVAIEAEPMYWSVSNTFLDVPLNLGSSVVHVMHPQLSPRFW
jgi:hypothetical protein